MVLTPESGLVVEQHAAAAIDLDIDEAGGEESARRELDHPRRRRNSLGAR